MATEKPKVSKSLVNFYALSAGMNTIAFTVPTLYLTMFMTDYLGISPIAIGTGMLIARTTDFIVSLIAGIVIEKTHMKHGKFLSWIRILTATLFFGNIIQMFDTSAFVSNPTFRLVIVMIGYMMYHCSMNFNQTARSSLIPKLAGADMDARKALTARQSQVGAAVSIISSAITLPLVQFIEKITGSPSAGYFLAALIFSSLFVVCNINFIRLATPFDPPEDANSVSARKRPTIGQMVESVVTNKQMLILFIAFTLTGIGNQLFAGVTTYWFRVTGNFSKYTYVLTARSICAFLASMVAPSIGRKLGKKGALLTSWSIAAVLSLGIRYLTLAGGQPRLMVMAVILCLRQACNYLYMVFMANYWLDCGEYGYYTSGVDNRTMSVTVMNWPTKISMAGGGALVGYGLAWAGYNAPSGGNMGSFDHMNRFLDIMGLIPAIVLIAAVVIVLLFYKLTDQQAAEYAKANAEREATAAAEK